MIALRQLAFAVALLGAGTSLLAYAAPPAADAPVQPGLSALVASRDAELRAAGVEQILARTGKGRRDIQVLTTWGPVYFPWSKNVKPVAFEIYFNTNGQTDAFAHDFSDATKASFSAALDAIVPQAIRGAANARAARLRPRA